MVVICGAANLYNDAICYALSHELGVECQIIASLTDLDGVLLADPRERPVLLLIDGSDGQYNSIVSDLHRGKQDFPAALLIAVHNLVRGQKIHPDLLRQGVRGLFYVEDNLSHFVKGVGTLLKGEVWVSRTTLLELTLDDSAQKLAMALDSAGLTHRETEILAHVSRGETNEEISERLCVSCHTVKTHLYNIYRKIDVNNRFQASLWAAKNMH